MFSVGNLHRVGIGLRTACLRTGLPELAADAQKPYDRCNKPGTENNVENLTEFHVFFILLVVCYAATPSQPYLSQPPLHVEAWAGLVNAWKVAVANDFCLRMLAHEALHITLQGLLLGRCARIHRREAVYTETANVDHMTACAVPPSSTVGNLPRVYTLVLIVRYKVLNAAVQVYHV